MKIYFIRHGETDWNDAGLIQGQIDNPLNEKGRQQAKEAADKIGEVEPTKIYSSQLSRARETIDIIKKINEWKGKVLIDERFQERDFGEFEGQYADEYKKKKDFSEYPEYEDNKEFEERIKEVISDIVEVSDDDDTIIVASHSHVMKSILVMSSDEYDYYYHLPNTAITEYEVREDGSLELIDIY